MKTLKLVFENYEVHARLNNTETSDAVCNALPLEAQISKWGDEIYFAIPAEAKLDTNASAEVQIGELAYWPTLPAFCIFYGDTPLSNSNNKPVAAGPVNVFGELINADFNVLRNLPAGSKVMVEQVFD